MNSKKPGSGRQGAGEISANLSCSPPAVALARTGDLQGALAFSDSAIEERGDTAASGLRAAMCCSPRRKRAQISFRERRWRSHRRIGFCRGSRAHPVLLPAIRPRRLPHATSGGANASHFLLWLELGRCQQALGLAGPARHSYERRPSNCNRIIPDVTRAFRNWPTSACSRALRWWRNLFRP